MKRSIRAYSVAIASVFVAVLVRLLLDPWMGNGSVFATVFGAVAISVWLCGYRSAILAAFLGYVACAYLFAEPRGHLSFTDNENLFRLIAYLFICAIIICFGEVARVSRFRFEQVLENNWRPDATGFDRWSDGLRDLAPFGFGLTLTVLAVGGALGYLNTQQLIENNRLVANSQNALEGMDKLLSMLADAETGQRGYLLTEDEKYLEPYNGAVADINSQLTQLREFASENPEQQHDLDLLSANIDAKLGEFKRTISLQKQGDRAAALDVVRENSGKSLMDDARKTIAEMQRAERELLQQRVLESTAISHGTMMSIELSSCIGAGLLGTVFYLNHRNIVQRQRAAEIVAQQRERLRVTLASIGDAVITTDADQMITFLNHVAEILTGWTNDEAAGKPLDSVFHIVNEQTRTQVENPAHRALRDGVIVGLANHTILISKYGKEHPIDDSASPIRDDRSAIVGCVLVFRDVTKRRTYEVAS